MKAAQTSPNCRCGAPFQVRAPDTFTVRAGAFAVAPFECVGGFWYWCLRCDRGDDK